MKRILSFLVLLSFALTLRASPTVAVETDLVSAYVFRGAQIATASIQPQVNAQWGDVYAGAWVNRALQPAQSSEVDFTLGGTRGPVDAGVTAYTYPGRGQTTWEPYVGVTHGDTFKTSLYAYHDLTLNVTTFEAKASKLISLKTAQVTLDAAVGTAHGRALETYAYWSAGPTVKTTLGRFTVNAGVQYVSSNASVKRDLVVTKVGIGF